MLENVNFPNENCQGERLPQIFIPSQDEEANQPYNQDARHVRSDNSALCLATGISRGSWHPTAGSDLILLLLLKLLILLRRLLRLLTSNGSHVRFLDNDVAVRKFWVLCAALAWSVEHRVMALL